MSNFDGPPVEPENGQDDLPDTLTAIRAVRVLLMDVAEHEAIDGDLLVRVLAHRRALKRLAQRLEEER